ncbi:MAG TPA: VCBS repeat-containing protein [Thermoanaerobaculia bacterium]|nr:VCBS repeat-containing protein [Thermoanaerobaculia bacterium]
MRRSLPSLPFLLLAFGLGPWLATSGCAPATPSPRTAGGDAEAAQKAPEANAAGGAEAKKPEAPVDPEKQKLLELAAGSKEKPPEIAKLEPPDGKWLVDEQGLEYFTTPVPRLEGGYRWLNDEHTKVRLPYGLSLDVASYDEANFYIKIYRPTGEKRRAKGSTPEEKAQIAESYRADLPASHRLRFAPFEAGLPKEGQWRNGFKIADINGDGHLDIVHGPARKTASRPQILLGDGKGNWKAWSSATYPSIAMDYGDVAVADWNGDGVNDLAVASHLRGIVVMVRDAEGHFKPWTEGIDFRASGEPGETPLFTSRAIKAVDWNRDGRPDIVAMGEGPRLAVARGPGGGEAKNINEGARGLRVFLNQGNGTWVSKTFEGSRLFGDDLALGDFNGDGLTDAVTGSDVLGYRAIVNLAKPDGSWEPTEIEALRGGALFRAVAAADFDKDGRDDLAVGYTSFEGKVWRTGIDLLYGRADGTWERRPLGHEESSTGIYSMSPGDLDGDGALDLAALDGKGRIWLFLADGKGGFTREETLAGEAAGLDETCRGYHIELADLDKDGRDEMVASFAGEGMTPFGERLCASGGSLRSWKASRSAEGEGKIGG